MLFDGRGGLGEATITGRPTSRTLAVRVGAHRVAEIPRPRLHVAAALPKGDRQSTLVAMATQLGMASFTPLSTARSIAHRGRHAVERWERVALAACKQSRNPWLPTFEPESKPRAFAERHADHARLILHPGEGAFGLQRLLAELDADRSRRPPNQAVDAEAPDEIALMIGPEGGFADDEVSACVAAGARCARFGGTILRTETAVVAALAAVRAHYDCS
jgi:16S rRNA (uracil1498-N3)-methyltransferase